MADPLHAVSSYALAGPSSSSSSSSASSSSTSPPPSGQHPHIRFQDEVQHTHHHQPAPTLTGPLIDIDEHPDEQGESRGRGRAAAAAAYPEGVARAGTSTHAMRDQPSYGATLSPSPRRTAESSSRTHSPAGALSPLRRGSKTAESSDGSKRFSLGPERVDLPSGSSVPQHLGAPLAGPSSSSSSPSSPPSPSLQGGGQPRPRGRAFSFKKRAPSFGAMSSSAHHPHALGAQARRASGPPRWLHRASFGLIGSREDGSAPSHALSAEGGIGGGGSPSGRGQGGARSRWRDLRRSKTLSLHQGGTQQGGREDDGSGAGAPLSPLNPDAYPDDGYGYGHADDDLYTTDSKPRIPPMLPSTRPDPDSNPIPTLPFFVLCVMIFGEFSSAGVAGPFLFFMINGFGVGDKAEVGFWAGIVSAVFFFAQFLTSMLWASVANRHGRRVVLFVALTGNCTATILFGTCTNLRMAIAVRLTQGLFNGAVGVAKGAVRDLTDSTNEARAYGTMGFWWGMGGIIGPILGGLLEHPVEKYPAVFGTSALLKKYPYLLPCLVVACSTGLGAVLSLFLGRDGGPRSGAIALPEKDTERAPVGGVGNAAVRKAAANVSSLGRGAGKRISGYLFHRGGPGAGAGGGVGAVASSSTALGADGGEGEPEAAGNIILERTAHGKDVPRTFAQQGDWDTGGPPSPTASDVTITTRRTLPTMDSGFDNRSIVSRALSRTSARRQSVFGGGSAYGYGRRASRSSQLASHHQHQQQQQGGHRLGPASARRDSSITPIGAHGGGARASVYAPDFEDVGGAGQSGLSFAQRFLLANDDAVLSLTDLWVAAAIGEEGGVQGLDEDPFWDEEDEEYDEEGDFDGVDGYTDDGEGGEEGLDGDGTRLLGDDDDEDEGTAHGSGSIDPSRSFRQALGTPNEDSPLLARRPLAPAHFANRKLSMAGRSDVGGGGGAASNSAFSSGTVRSHATTAARAGGVGGGGPRRPSRGGPSRRGRSNSSSTAGAGAGPHLPLLYAQAGVELPRGFGPSPTFAHDGGGGGGVASNSYFPAVSSTDSAGGGSHEAGLGGMSGSSSFEPALADIPESSHAIKKGGQSGGGAPSLATLRDGAATSAFSSRGVGGGAGASAISGGVGGGVGPPQSVWALLPLAIVVQYGVMSWHASMFDQVFMAFLVTDVPSGGLGLTAAHFAELIAVMAIGQMYFQFRFYPNVGPPRGKYTHLAMLRMGLALYLPIYTTFPLLRRLLSSTDVTVMSGMIVVAGVRLMANVTAFTACTVLMNAMTPPHLVPLTNGLAQTISSLMRCIGPIVGGIVWAHSIEGGPDARPWPFNFHLGFWVVGLVGFAGFLHSLTIR